ncbi:thioesterase family protein [Microbacterium sp.]|uniref:thioesterase family protein n=1 Tax=Microbacterium sp. TaxID=51671 RepID=UPI003341ADB7
MAAYFERLDENTYRATDATQGAWNIEEQHIAPVLGLLTHTLERDHAPRHEHPLPLARVSFDILGVIPIGEVEVEARVIRPGRTIELVEATVSHGGRAAATARGWFMKTHDTAGIAGSDFAPMPPRTGMPAWAADAWPGEFVRTPEILRAEEAPGRARSWLRPRVPLVEGESASPTARLMGLVDIANGLTPRVSPSEVAFPNLDLTAHLLRAPEGEWLGFDTTMSVGPTGLGITHTVLHDDNGPLGTSVQSLTVRPLA